MGITGIWDYFGEGEVKSLAAFSTACLVNEGRPLRIAVDEANWRFLNLTPEQVKAIQRKEPASRPIEKAIFYRIVGLQLINIQLLFVFDGPRRPWKRGRHGGSKIDYEELRLIKKLFDMLGVPYHEAPGEAEAECAKLQQEGIVDAVWTDDSDAMMFGATRLIRSYYEGKKKSTTHIRFFQAKHIKEISGLDKEGMVLFAMLSGGDYDTKGLYGCGASMALAAAKAGLGRSLCKAASPLELQSWRHQLVGFFESKRKRIDVPLDFPCPKLLKKYTHPCTSTTEQLHNLRGLRNGWGGRALDEVKLRSFLRTRFNIQTKGYIKHILPTLLAKTLSLTEPGLERANNIYNVELVVNKRKKGDPDTSSMLRKVTFLPQRVTTLDFSKQPDGAEDGEDWSSLGTKGGPFDPLAKAECEILECILRKGVPHVLEEAMKKAEADATSSPMKKSKKMNQQGPMEKDRKKAPYSTKKRKAALHEAVLDTNNSSTAVATDQAKTAKKQRVDVKDKHAKASQEKACPSSQSSTTEKASSARKPRQEFLVPPSLSLSPLPHQLHATPPKQIPSTTKAVVVDLSLDTNEEDNLSAPQSSLRDIGSDYSYHTLVPGSTSRPTSRYEQSLEALAFQQDPFSSRKSGTKATSQLQKHRPRQQLSPVSKPSWAMHGFALLDGVLDDSVEVDLPDSPHSPPSTSAAIGSKISGRPDSSAPRPPVLDVIDLTFD